MKRFFCLMTVLAVGVLAFGAATANAAVHSWFSGAPDGCFDGTATVPAGQPASFRIGWATNSVARTQKFLDSQYRVFNVSGAVNSSTSYPAGSTTGWSPITVGTDGSGGTVYVVTWVTPEVTLAAGQSVTITVSLKADKKTWDSDKQSYNANTEMLVDAAGHAYTTCVVTGA